MAGDLELKIKLTAELAELKKSLNDASAEIKGLGDSLARTGAGGTSNLERSITSARNGLALLAAGFAALQSLRGLAQMADQAATLNARLKLATNSAKELGIAQAGLFDIAQRTRNDLAQTVELYAKLSLATKEAGVSQGELLRITETIGKAVQLSGASAASSEAAIIQLAQGLASGALRGEELNSVLEQTPRLAQAIAAGMGVSIGKLRELGQNGQLTAQNVLSALSNQAQTIDREFAQLPLRISDAVTQTKNNLLVFVGDLDKATGASSSIATAIASIGESLNEVDFSPAIEAVQSFGAVVDDTLAGLEPQFNILRDLVAGTALLFGESMIAMGRAANDNLGEGSETIDAFDFLGFTVRNLPALVAGAIQEVVVNLLSFGDKVAVSATAIRDRITAIFTDDTIEQVNDRWIAQLKELETLRVDSIASIRAETSENIAAGQAAAERFRAEREERKKAEAEAKKVADAARAASANKKPVGTQEKTAAADQAAIAKAEAEITLREIERIYSDGKLKQAEYFAEKRRLTAEINALEIAQIDAKISAAEKADEKSKLLTDREVARRRGAAQIADINSAEQAANSARARQTEQLQVELARIEGRGAEARALELREKYRETLERMRLDGDTAGIAIIERIINVETGKAKLDELEKNYRETLDRLKTREQSLADQSEIGSIPQAQADQGLQDARATAITELQALREQYQLLAQQDVPGATAALAQLDQQLASITRDGASGAQAAINSLRAELAQMQRNIVQTVASAGVDALSGLFEDLASGSKSAGDALKDFARNFVASMIQIAARALATFAVLQLLDAVYPGLGRATAGAASVGASVKHTGGIVGRGGAVRSVDPMIFAGAPRYHSGGIAGLKPGEVPAILQTGEEVLARNDPRNSANGGGQQGGQGVRILNVIDPNLVQDYMASSSGEQTLLNVIQRNAGSIKQVLT